MPDEIARITSEDKENLEIWPFSWTKHGQSMRPVKNKDDCIRTCVYLYMLHHTATQCNDVPQHTAIATHCNHVQHTAAYDRKSKDDFFLIEINGD